MNEVILVFFEYTVLLKEMLEGMSVFSYFPFGFEGRIWDLIVSDPDHCLSFYFAFIITAHEQTQ